MSDLIVGCWSDPWSRWHSEPGEKPARSRQGGFLIEGSPQGRIRKGVGEWRVWRGFEVTQLIAAMGRSNSRQVRFPQNGWHRLE